MLISLVQQGFLITSLRAPMTIGDPLARLVEQLHTVDAASVPSAATLLAQLEHIQIKVSHQNHAATSADERAGIRRDLAAAMSVLSTAGRTPLATNLRLDCAVRLPRTVAHEMERAASALMLLTRQPTGQAPWRDYYAAFCDRYGTNTIVPLADVVDPDAGLGLPPTYPGSTMATPSTGGSERDQQLLALAWAALVDCTREITLTEQTIESLVVGEPTRQLRIPPHVELAARIHAPDVEALERGDYTLVVAPARSAGTLTSRFSRIVPDAGLAQLYASVPVASKDALPVQLSFPPIYAHAENVSRVPAYLPHTLALGEHRGHSENTIPADDLGVLATHERLRLASLSRQRVLEPQAFHALALEKQSPPLARFLAHLSRGNGAAWHEFDWGPAAGHLAFLPRVRYGRSVLSPAQWRVTSDDLPSNLDLDAWIAALDQWRRQWACPDHLELRDADRSLPLTLTIRAHAAVLQALPPRPRGRTRPASTRVSTRSDLYRRSPRSSRRPPVRRRAARRGSGDS